jgi:hypothetical protein
MNNPVNATDPMGLYVPLEPEAPFAGDVCVTFNCGHPYDPEGWVLPYPQLPPPRVRFPGLPVLSHILPGEDSLNWPLGPSPTEILRQILSANYSVFGVPTLEELTGRAWIMDATKNGTAPGANPLATSSCDKYKQGGRWDLYGICKAFPTSPKSNFIRGCLQANFDSVHGIYNESPILSPVLLGPLGAVLFPGYGASTHAYCISRGIFYGE